MVSPSISLHRSRWFEVTNNRVKWLVSAFSKRSQQSEIVYRIASVGLEWKLSLPRSTSLIPIRVLLLAPFLRFVSKIRSLDAATLALII